jgi:hypothetical protein
LITKILTNALQLFLRKPRTTTAQEETSNADSARTRIKSKSLSKSTKRTLTGQETTSDAFPASWDSESAKFTNGTGTRGKRTALKIPDPALRAVYESESSLILTPSSS